MDVIYLRLPEALKKKIRRMANKEKISMTEVIVAILAARFTDETKTA
jgi:hypothetical protein